MGGKGLLNAHPKPAYGSRGGRRCRVCVNPSAIIRKYKIDMCRQCFRERALDIGFMKVLNRATPTFFLYHFDSLLPAYSSLIALIIPFLSYVYSFTVQLSIFFWIGLPEA